MRFTLKYFYIILIITTFLVCDCLAFAPTNFFESYDQNVALPIVRRKNIKLGGTLEYGQTTRCRDYTGKTADVLKIHNSSENVLQMLLSASDAGKDEATNFVNGVIANTLDLPSQAQNSTFAAVSLEGSYRRAELTCFGKYKLPTDFLSGRLSLGLAIPLVYSSIYSLKYTDLTAANGNAALADVIKSSYTQDLSTLNGQLQNYCNGLSLGTENDTGVGDLLFLLEWNKKFKQEKSNVKNVDVNCKLGLSIPTGKQKDVNRALSMSLGNDGAWGVPFGIGLVLEGSHKMRLGFDFEVFALFNHAKERRMKTRINETEFLLANKGRATLDHGLEWRFNGFLQFYKFYKELSVKAGYQYKKHDSDNLTPKTNDFDRTIINTANGLQEWNTQNAILQLNYDFVNCLQIYKPQLSLFVKIPITGKNVIMPFTFGGQIGFNF